MMTRVTKFYVTMSLVTALLLTANSCGRKVERYAVSGTVTVGGQPISGCTIIFGSTSNSSESTTTSVQDGQFSIETMQGLPTGDYLVYLTETQPELEDFERMKRQGLHALNATVLPHNYLKRQTLNAKVSSAGENVYHFDLPGN